MAQRAEIIERVPRAPAGPRGDGFEARAGSVAREPVEQACAHGDAHGRGLAARHVRVVDALVEGGARARRAPRRQRAWLPPARLTGPRAGRRGTRGSSRAR